MLAFTYILFSRKLNRYYIGSTELEPEERLKLHLAKNYGNKKFTSKVHDWEIFLCIECENISTPQ
ncbi:MAG: GIY-YIG nuclease family protein [Prolixibacteraceae bacterium]|nr:GIY-YIG nuclease family protein [Prolixibacteraceae bacterium]